MKKLFITMIWFVFSCSSHEGAANSKIASQVNEAYELKTLLIPVGNTEKVKIFFKDAKTAQTIKCLDKSIPFEVNGNHLIFFISESYFSNLTPYDCKIFFGSDQKKLESLTIISIVPQKKDFKEETLSVDSKRVELSKKDSKRAQKEQLILNDLYARSNKVLFTQEPFSLPMNSSLTSYYGTKRVFNGVKQTQHLGNDFKASVGQAVLASNSGKVMLARNLFYSGNTIILDHGLGVFTIYAHLSKFFVKEGTQVSHGQKIANSGRTGRVTGPHLHWGVKIHGEWVDGFSLVKTSRPN